MFTQWVTMITDTASARVLLQPGQPAPRFSLPDPDLNPVSLDDFRNRRNVVLYFYPKDDTPGCTMEAIDFSELEDDFGALKTIVLGVNMDDCVSHGAFRDKHGLSVQLLADVDGEVCRDYRVLQEKEVEGRKKTCVVRSTFIIDRKGQLRHVFYGVTPRGHAAEMLDLVRRGAKCR
ncbi:MAG: peroxiredoxin [Burkholderiales bacterium]|nr:peroxiredoxin [Burkholderiales bacterium]